MRNRPTAAQRRALAALTVWPYLPTSNTREGAAFLAELEQDRQRSSFLRFVNKARNHRRRR